MNPYAPPGSAPPGSAPRGRYTARLEGETLVVSRDADLPSVCVKCGSHDAITRRTTPLQWTPVWARFLMFCLVGLILILVTTKRATLEVPLCAPCNARWTAARNASMAGVVVVVAAFVAMRTMDDQWLGAGILGATFIGFIGLTVSFARPRVLRAKRIDETSIHLAGVHEAAAKEIVAASS